MTHLNDHKYLEVWLFQGDEEFLLELRQYSIEWKLDFR